MEGGGASAAEVAVSLVDVVVATVRSQARAMTEGSNMGDARPPKATTVDGAVETWRQLHRRGEGVLQSWPVGAGEDDRKYRVNVWPCASNYAKYTASRTGSAPGNAGSASGSARSARRSAESAVRMEPRRKDWKLGGRGGEEEVAT
jgi:hypothetical protein